MAVKKDASEPFILTNKITAMAKILVLTATDLPDLGY
jgi:hypothetical protein